MTNVGVALLTRFLAPQPVAAGIDRLPGAFAVDPCAEGDRAKRGNYRPRATKKRKSQEAHLPVLSSAPRQVGLQRKGPEAAKLHGPLPFAACRLLRRGWLLVGAVLLPE